MRPMKIVAITLSALLTGAPVALAEVIGSTDSDAVGTGEILVEVDPTADPEYVRQQIIDNVRITEGGQLQEVTVKDGVLSIKFVQSTAKTLVEAVIDDDIAAWLLRGSAVAGTGAGVGGLGVPGLIGAGVIAGTLTGVAASGTLHPDDDDEPSASQ
jgi:hypothetical protein